MGDAQQPIVPPQIGKKVMTIDIYERAAGVSFIEKPGVISPRCIMLATVCSEKFFSDLSQVTLIFKDEDVKLWKEGGDNYFAQHINFPYTCAFNEILQSKRNPYYAEERDKYVF